MNKPRIFLGSSGKQAKLLQAITRGLEDVADVEPWTTTFNPGRSTLDRLVELSHQVDFAAFVFAQDDWTAAEASQTGEASPRDNVVFEAGLFGGALGMRRTFILHANGAKLPTDLLGLTAVRYDPSTSPAEVRAINQKLRKAIETEGRRGPVEGLLVAALADRADRGRAVGGEPRADLTGPRRRPECDRPGLAGGRHPVGALLERGREGTEGSGRHLLLLEGRAPSAPERSAARRHGRDQAGEHRPRHRVLDDSLGSRRRAECPNLRYLFPQQTPQTSRCWTAAARSSGPSSSRNASASGSRLRTHSDHQE